LDKKDEFIRAHPFCFATDFADFRELKQHICVNLCYLWLYSAGTIPKPGSGTV